MAKKKPKMIQVGPDAFNEWDMEKVPEGTRAVVYFYRRDSYEGHGEAILDMGDGFVLVNLGHCSCYGPLDGAKADERMSKTAMLKYLKSGLGHIYPEETALLAIAFKKYIA